MPLPDPRLADAFTYHLTRQGWSSATTRQFMAALARWEDWLSLHRRALTVRTAGHHDIVAYLAWLRDNAASHAYVGLALGALRAYYGWIRPTDDPTARLG